jgi:hypothetical protein
MVPLTTKMGEQGFVWFTGIVVDIIDPLKAGHVRVRIPSEHGLPEAPGLKAFIETADLHWAKLLMPNNSASFEGVGISPTGIFIGSHVVGFYLDAEKTIPMVLGTINYPNRNDKKINDVSSIARGEGPVQKNYSDYEPKTKYKAEYPFNKTVTTESGHVLELDDTPDSERIHVYHKSGSYVEINPDGSIVTRSVKDSAEVVMNDKGIAVESGDMTILIVNGEITIEAKGNVNIYSGSTITIEAPLVSING